jgi:hypothetical protein
MDTLYDAGTTMLALINPVALPALRFDATFFLLINLAGGTYIFRNVHRFFVRDRTVDNDIRQLVT